MFATIQFVMMCALLYGGYKLAGWIDDMQERRSGR